MLHWDFHSKSSPKIVEEAGGTVTCMDGGKFCVFDRSILVSNGALHEKLLERIGPATEKLKSKGTDFSLWYKPESLRAKLGRLN
ncbi:phosphatase IMPL1, chloroplastic-like [Quercus robur]|uniref:phosphatase IMPL1, chloroplastic-like n=1 Tax=Quercus robur TaxID=38942 RepID=UPI002162DB67|nr:phosphatase IMPL1, chloroplastic-like [Quercus robur]